MIRVKRLKRIIDSTDGEVVPTIEIGEYNVLVTICTLLLEQPKFLDINCVEHVIDDDEELEFLVFNVKGRRDCVEWMRKEHGETLDAIIKILVSQGTNIKDL